MSKQDLFAQTMEIRPGDHLVALYSEEQEIVDYVTAFIRSALAQNARCLYITGDIATEAVLRQIPRRLGGLTQRGDLLILDRADVYTQQGVFSPDSLVANIKEMATSH